MAHNGKPQFDMQMMTNIISLLSMAHVFPTALVVIGLAVLEVLVESQGEYSPLAAAAIPDPPPLFTILFFHEVRMGLVQWERQLGNSTRFLLTVTVPRSP